MFLNLKNITSDVIKTTLDDLKQKTTELLDSLVLVKDEELCWDTFIQPELQLEIDLSYDLQMFNLDSLHPDEKIREVCNECSTELSQFNIDVSMRKDIFKKFRYYYENQYTNTEKNTLSSERIKYIEDNWKNYKKNGFLLDDENFEQSKIIKKEISKMEHDFHYNLTNENTTFNFEKEDLIGLQYNWLESRLVENETNKYKVSLKYPDYIPVMEYCTNRETRKKIMTAFNSRCDKENEDICKKIFKLRYELAQKLGYNTYADYALQNNMAKCSDDVMMFLNTINIKLKDAILSDYNNLKLLSKEDGIDKLELYDMPHYMRLYKEKLTSLDYEKLREYFSFDTVTSGIFQIYQQFLGVKFNEITDKYVDNFWHESVRLFEVTDSVTKKLMGYFYLDMFPREGKYGHAAVFPFVLKSLQTLPICSLVCNFDAKNGLTHHEVETYFHEFGHAMHNICSETEILSFGGTSVEIDFVEMPSQCMEEWCYINEPLKIMSGNLIPDDIIELIKKQRNICKGYHYGRQLTFGLSDMFLHSVRWNEDSNDVYNSVLYNVLKMELPKECKFMNSFGHIMGGYEAGYYSYMWSEAFSKDIFKTCIFGNELDPETGRRYRKEILSYGGSRNSMNGIVALLGRQPNIDNFINSITE